MNRSGTRFLSDFHLVTRRLFRSSYNKPCNPMVGLAINKKETQMKNANNAPATPAFCLEAAIDSLEEITTKILTDVALPWVDIDPAVVGDWVLALSLVKNALTGLHGALDDDDDEQEEA